MKKHGIFWLEVNLGISKVFKIDPILENIFQKKAWYQIPLQRFPTIHK